MLKTFKKHDCDEKFKVISVGSGSNNYKVMFQSIKTGRYLYKKGVTLISDVDNICSRGREVEPDYYECVEREKAIFTLAKWTNKGKCKKVDYSGRPLHTTMGVGKIKDNERSKNIPYLWTLRAH